MTLTARIIGRDDLDKIINLGVHPAQEALVAPNSITIAQAGFEPGSTVFGLWDNDVPVGLMAVINMPDYPFPEEGDDIECAYLWRLMIDKDQQGKGYGTASLKLLVDLAKSWNLPRVTASVGQGENSAMSFYEAFGFHQTGAVQHDEIVISLTI